MLAAMTQADSMTPPPTSAQPERPNPATPWLTTEQVADYAQMSICEVYRAAQEGRLRGSKIGRGRKMSPWRFHRDNVDAWLRANENVQ